MEDATTRQRSIPRKQSKMNHLNQEIHDQVEEMIEMVEDDGQWEEGVCQNWITIAIHNKFQELNIDDDELLQMIMKAFEAQLTEKDYTCEYTTTQEDGDDDHYIQFEFQFIKKE